MKRHSAAALLEALTEIRAQYIEEAARPHRPGWLRWGALAAVLVIAISLALWSSRPETPAVSIPSSPDTMDGPPTVTVNDIEYMLSSRPSSYDDCPDGFVYGGVIAEGDMAGAAYYVNPEIPEHIYLCAVTHTNGIVDPATGALERTELHLAYIRYADLRVRGKDLIRRGDTLYLSMWDVWNDVDEALYEAVEAEYGRRIETETVEGFSLLGEAVFTGYDTIPDGELSCNFGSVEVYVNPDDDRVILVPTVWYTAARDEPGQTRHTGYEIFVRCNIE